VIGTFASLRTWIVAIMPESFQTGTPSSAITANLCLCKRSL
jgi:hypothetical protein